ncbi:MAG: hypothetical protein MJ179_07670 [Treponema sp.]|nr:hypothetical protein [Treponema sp.]
MQSQQVLVPRQVYIGDSAELRCTFETESVLFRNLVAQKGNIELSKEYFMGELDASKWDVKNVVISSSGYNKYTLSVSFVPWRTGNIDLPAFDMGAALNSDAEIYVMGFQRFEVVSITKTQSLSSLRDIQSPLLLPGTTYKVYGLIILLLLLIIAIIRITIKRKKFVFFIKNEILLWKYRKNKKATFKQLLKLEQDKVSADNQIASEMQKIIRAYLEFRMDYPFTKLVTSEMMEGFYKATCNLLSDKKTFAAEEIIRVFVRTDFIRYSKDAAFNVNERQQLISTLMNSIETLEAAEVPELEEETVVKEKGGKNA